jgi:hypothetical protein
MRGNTQASVRPEPFDAACGGALDKLRRGALAQSHHVRPSTSLGTSGVGAGHDGALK